MGVVRGVDADEGARVRGGEAGGEDDAADEGAVARACPVPEQGQRALRGLG